MKCHWCHVFFFPSRNLYMNPRAGMASPGPHISEQSLAERNGCGCEMDAAAGPKGAAGGGCSHLHSFRSISSWRKIKAAAATLETCFHSGRIPLLSPGGITLRLESENQIQKGVGGGRGNQITWTSVLLRTQGICSFIHQPVLREGLLCARHWDLSTRIQVWPGLCGAAL